MTRRLMPNVSLSLIVLLLSALAATTVAAEEKKVPKCETPAFTCTNGLCRLDVSFPASEKCSVRIDDAFIRANTGSSRITEKTTLRIRVVNVNLLQYAVAFETKETVIDSYVYLEKLWQQILGLGNIAGALPSATEAERDRDTTFVNAINDWRTALDTAAKDVAKTTTDFPNLILTAADKAKIATEAARLKTWVDKLVALQDNAKRTIARVEHFALYDETLKTHQAVLDKLDAFEALSKQIEIGFEKRITFGDAGRVVAVTITATQKSTGKEQTQIIGVEFLVHSTLPVTFHAGYTVRALKELSFESVGTAIQTAGGADLFAKVQDSEANGTFTAFMSYRLCDISRANRCPHLTIGTDFKNVGDRLYGGVSWPLGRAFITAGVVSGETKEGEGPVNDVLTAAGQVLDSRELFTAISTKRKWGGFFGLSFAPF
jgi:hypothetical protein